MLIKVKPEFVLKSIIKQISLSLSFYCDVTSACLTVRLICHKALADLKQMVLQWRSELLLSSVTL